MKASEKEEEEKSVKLRRNACVLVKRLVPTPHAMLLLLLEPPLHKMRINIRLPKYYTKEKRKDTTDFRLHSTELT